MIEKGYSSIMDSYLEAVISSEHDINKVHEDTLTKIASFSPMGDDDYSRGQSIAIDNICNFSALDLGFLHGLKTASKQDPDFYTNKDEWTEFETGVCLSIDFLKSNDADRDVLSLAKEASIFNIRETAKEFKRNVKNEFAKGKVSVTERIRHRVDKAKEGFSSRVNKTKSGVGDIKDRVNQKKENIKNDFKKSVGDASARTAKSKFGRAGKFFLKHKKKIAGGAIIGGALASVGTGYAVYRLKKNKDLEA